MSAAAPLGGMAGCVARIEVTAYRECWFTSGVIRMVFMFMFASHYMYCAHGSVPLVCISPVLL